MNHAPAVPQHNVPQRYGRNETMGTEGNEAVFSLLRLLRLAEDLESDAATFSYAATFLEMLPARVERIISTVLQGDTAAAMDAVLSLKVRSNMVGGLALERSCRLLQECLHNDGPSAAVVAAESVARDGDALRSALEEFLRR